MQKHSQFRYPKPERKHTRGDGQPKFGHADWQSARRQAAAMTERFGEPFEAYRCATCAFFHVGRAPKKAADLPWREEAHNLLGARVATHLTNENAPSIHRRYGAVTSRFRAVERRRRSPAPLP